MTGADAALTAAYDLGWTRAVDYALARYGPDDHERRDLTIALAAGALIDDGIQPGSELDAALGAAYDTAHLERWTQTIDDLSRAAVVPAPATNGHH